LSHSSHVFGELVAMPTQTKVWTKVWSARFTGQWHDWELMKLTNEYGKVTEVWHTVEPANVAKVKVWTKSWSRRFTGRWHGWELMNELTITNGEVTEVWHTVEPASLSRL
jgi:hypothetical protein